MEINKTAVLNNIYTLAKNKGMKIGELEEAAGISTGYLSKLKSDDSRSVPGVEILLNIALQLGVTLDVLICSDIEALNADERFIMLFINDLLKKTDAGKMGWQKLNENQLYNYHDSGEWYETAYPMFDIFGATEYGPNVHYKSEFYTDASVECDGNSFRSLIAEDKWIYLMSVKIHENGKRGIINELELYIYSNGELMPLCCKYTTPTFTPFKAILEKLYDVLGSKTGHQTVTLNAIEEMADFMGIEVPDELALPF